MSRKLTWILTAATAGCALTSTYLWQRLETAEAAAASAIQAKEDAERKLLMLQSGFASRPRGSETVLDQGEPSSRSDRSNQTESPNLATPSRDRRQYDRGFGAEEVLGEDMIATLKLGDTTALAMSQVLRDERQKLRQLRDERKGSFADQNTVDTIRDETDRRLRELLGDEKFAELQEYKSYAAEYERLGRLDRRLARDGMATLSESQRISLLAAMKQVKNAVPPPTAAQFQTQKEFQLAHQAWRASQEQRTQQWAATILTPEQLARFNANRRNGPPPPPRS